MSYILPTQEQLKGYKKTLREAETASFMCLLLYFTIKFCTVLIFYAWNNHLWHRYELLGMFGILLTTNTYFMLTTGKNPGFYQQRISQDQKSQLMNHQKHLLSKNNHPLLSSKNNNLNFKIPHQQQSQSLFSQPISDSLLLYPSEKPCQQVLQNYCKLCQCIRRNRMKHCYSCGRCVMKFDHHCPWIGSCVGELNHGKFLLSLIAHTLQASFTLWICLKSLDLYKYYDENSQTFATQYGVLILWSLFMALYTIFAGGLLIFHSYLVGANVTTRELMSRRRCIYLKNVEGNPFDEGLIKNLVHALIPDENGREWRISKRLESCEGNKRWYQKAIKNQYYECC